MISRREVLAISASAAIVPLFPALANAVMAEWKRDFAAEFTRYVDVKSSPNRAELLAWIAAETDDAFDLTENVLDTDPAEEAREWVYAIGAMA